MIWCSTVFFSLFSAYLAINGLQKDPHTYLFNANILLEYLHQDFKHFFGLYFLTGGNSYYPDSYFPMLDRCNTWPQYSAYTITKAYTLFAQLSSPNLYNISLFFAFLSFIAKWLWIKIVLKRTNNKIVSKFLIIFIVLGGTDIYFISGIYKETLAFFFISVCVYSMLVSGKLAMRLVVFGLSFFPLIFIRIELGFFFLFASLMDTFIHYFPIIKWKGKTILVFSILLFIGVLYKSPLLKFVFIKMSQFEEIKHGNTYKPILHWSNSLLENIYTMFKSIFLIFYTPIYSIKPSIYYGCIEFSTILFFILFIYLSKTVRIISKPNFVLLLLIGVFGLLLIAFVVPNYIAQLRYRSIYIFILVIFLLLNSKDINKNYI